VVWSVVMVVTGLVLLVLAADRLVVAVVKVSRALGLSAILVGAVVVGLGTSIPELIVSGLAAADDNLDVAMANVVGSNITNVTLVLGAAALVAPMKARLQTLRREGVLMLAAVVALMVVLIDGAVARYEGFLLVAGAVLALALLVRWSILDSPDEERLRRSVFETVDMRRRSVIGHSVIGLAALIMTVYSANILLQGALNIGEELDLSAAFLGVMLGIGTSLPELATALAAVRRNEPDLVIGNVLGSNLFNSLAVAGFAGAVRGGSLNDPSALLLWVMLVSALMAGAMARTGSRIRRGEGVILLVGFAVSIGVAY
jgi:cation:H+ antiporter